MEAVESCPVSQALPHTMQEEDHHMALRGWAVVQSGRQVVLLTLGEEVGVSRVPADQEL